MERVIHRALGWAFGAWPVSAPGARRWPPASTGGRAASCKAVAIGEADTGRPREGDPFDGSFVAELFSLLRK